MKHYTRLACGLVALVMVAVGMAGCASDVMTAQEIATLNKQRLEAHKDYWRNRMTPVEKTEVIGPIPIGDRRVTLKVRALFSARKTDTGWTMLDDIKYTQYLKIKAKYGGMYELIDSDTGKVILPLDYWAIVPVPGVGVFVHKPSERFDANNSKANKKPGPAWRLLDLETGEMPVTDVRLVQTYVKPSDNHGYGYSPDPLTEVSVIGRADPASTRERPLSQFEVYPIYKAGSVPVTEPLVYGRVLGEPTQSLFTGAGKFSFLTGVDEQDKQLTLLLDEQLRYVLETDQLVRKFHAQSMTKMTSTGSREIVSYLATTAPGTTPADDLWFILDENGRFGAPPDVIGYRPINDRWKPDDGSTAGARPFDGLVERWMVRKRTTDTTPFTDYSNGVRGYNTRWAMVDGDFTTLGYTPLMWDYQLFRVTWVNRRQDSLMPHFFNESDQDRVYERVFMACLQKEGWTIVDPFGKLESDRAFSRIFAKIAGPTEAVPALAALHQAEVTHRAKLEKEQQRLAAIEAAAALAKRRAWIDENWERQLKNGNYKWCASMADERGWRSWFELAEAMPYPTVEFLNQVMARTTYEPDQKDLQRMLVLAGQREADQLAQYWAQEKEQKRLRWLASHPSYSGGGGGGSSSSSSGGSSRSSVGGGMTAGWKVSDDQKRAFMKALGTSQHRINMGWSNPYAY